MYKCLSLMMIASLTLAMSFSIVSAAPVFGIDKSWNLWLELSPCDDGSSFVIYNDGDYVLGWVITTTEDWLSVEPTSGSNLPGLANGTVVTISVDRTGLEPGRYVGDIQITTNIPDTHVERVAMNVQDAPLLYTYAPTLSFSPEVVERYITVRNKGRETLDWVVASRPPWIDIVPGLSGSLECTTYINLSVYLNPAGLPSPDEEQTGEIVIDSNGGTSTLPAYYYPADQTAGMIGIFADPAGTNCNILYGGPGLLSVYVVHMRTPGAVACQFSAPIPECWTNAVWLSDTAIFPINIGNSQTGTAVGYGTCQPSPMHVTTINYFVQGPPGETCCLYPVLPDPHVASGEIEVMDCNDNVLYAEGGTAVLYPTAACMCEGGAVTVEESTWGRVKALYAPEPGE